MQFPPVALRNDLVSYQRNGLQNVKKFYRACHAIVAELMESKIFSKKKKQVLKDILFLKGPFRNKMSFNTCLHCCRFDVYCSHVVFLAMQCEFYS